MKEAENKPGFCSKLPKAMQKAFFVTCFAVSLKKKVWIPQFFNIKMIPTPQGYRYYFGVRARDFVPVLPHLSPRFARCPVGENASPKHFLPLRSLIVRIPCFLFYRKNKRQHYCATFHFWRRARDSNPRTVYRRYTISNRAPSASSDNSPYSINYAIIHKDRKKIKSYRKIYKLFCLCQFSLYFFYLTIKSSDSILICNA